MSDRIIVMRQRSIAGELEAGPQESDIMPRHRGHDVARVAGRAAQRAPDGRRVQLARRSAGGARRG